MEFLCPLRYLTYRQQPAADYARRARIEQSFWTWVQLPPGPRLTERQYSAMMCTVIVHPSKRMYAVAESAYFVGFFCYGTLAFRGRALLASVSKNSNSKRRVRMYYRLLGSLIALLGVAIGVTMRALGMPLWTSVPMGVAILLIGGTVVYVVLKKKAADKQV